MIADTSIVAVALARTTQHVETHIADTSDYGIVVTEPDYETIHYVEPAEPEYERQTCRPNPKEIEKMFETDPYAEARAIMKKLEDEVK